MLLQPGDEIRVEALAVEGVCSRVTRDASGDEAAEFAYLDGNGVIQKQTLAFPLLRVAQGDEWVPVIGRTL